MSRYRFIAEEKAHHSVVLLCRVLGVAKSAFYAWQQQQASARAQADERLTNEIKAIYEDSHCTYGAPRVHAELCQRGKRVARKRVARLEVIRDDPERLDVEPWLFPPGGASHQQLE